MDMASKGQEQQELSPSCNKSHVGRKFTGGRSGIALRGVQALQTVLSACDRRLLRPPQLNPGRERRTLFSMNTVIYDDAYGVFTETDQVAVMSEAWKQMEEDSGEDAAREG